MSFAGQTVAITGASRGLGLPLARQLASHGARLALMARDGERLREAAAGLGNDTLLFPGDVTSENDCGQFIGEIVAEHGALDHLIANAGQSMWARFEEIENLELLRRLVEVNYLGVAHCIHAALPALRKSRGQVVVISSIQGKIGVPFHSGYSASKHALEGLVDTLRSELHGTGINFLQIYTDWIRGTGMRQNALGSDGQAVGDRKHDHRGAGVTVDECARAILRAMAKGRSSLYIPRKLQYVSCLKMFFPGLLRWGIRRRLDTQK